MRYLIDETGHIMGMNANDDEDWDYPEELTVVSSDSYPPSGVDLADCILVNGTPVVDEEKVRKREEERPLTTLEFVEQFVLPSIVPDVNALDVPEEVAGKVARFYPDWEAGVGYAAGYYVYYSGSLYKCLQPHTSQSGWEPPQVPALWSKVKPGQKDYVPPDPVNPDDPEPEPEYAEWVQPTGAHDAYAKGDKVVYEGKVWESTIDANVWAPGVYGWNQIDENVLA